MYFVLSVYVYLYFLGNKFNTYTIRLTNMRLSVRTQVETAFFFYFDVQTTSANAYVDLDFDWLHPWFQPESSFYSIMKPTIWQHNVDWIIKQIVFLETTALKIHEMRAFRCPSRTWSSRSYLYNNTTTREQIFILIRTITAVLSVFNGLSLYIDRLLPYIENPTTINQTQERVSPIITYKNVGISESCSLWHSQGGRQNGFCREA